MPVYTRFVGKPERGGSNVFLTYFDYFFGGQYKFNWEGVERHQGVNPLPRQIEHWKVLYYIIKMINKRIVNLCSNYFSGEILPTKTQLLKHEFPEGRHACGQWLSGLVSVYLRPAHTIIIYTNKLNLYICYGRYTRGGNSTTAEEVSKFQRL